MEFKISETADEDSRRGAVDTGERSIQVKETDDGEMVATVWVGGNGTQASLTDIVEAAYDNL